MKVSVLVYTKDIDSAFSAVRKAVEENILEIQLRSEDWEPKERVFIIVFKADHTSAAISHLDGGNFYPGSQTTWTVPLTLPNLS